MAGAALQVREFRKAQSNVVLLAERELRKFYRSLDPNNPLAAVRALEEYLPLLIQQYGEIGATVAADFYDELRQNSGVRKAYKAVMGNAIPIEQARVSTKWAVGPLFQAEPDSAATYSNLVDVTDRLIKQHGRNTIRDNGLRDPATVRWARVPTGSDTCTFCLKLASRGAVYRSEDTAANLHKYHGKCDCVPTPVWNDNDLDDLKASGYDPDGLYDRWQERLEAEKAAKAAS